MPDFLAQMAAASADRAGIALPYAAKLRAKARDTRPPRPLTLSTAFDLIAEIKLASPSAGRLIDEPGSLGTVAARAAAYSEAGAAAISVLTEPTRFEGSLSHLTEAALAATVPVMRKDFLVHPVQIHEARAAGADGVLLIARILPASLLREMTALALDHGMFVLIEAFDKADAERTAAAAAAFPATSPLLTGVNTRDLATLTIDRTLLQRLGPLLPAGRPRVAESGIDSPIDVVRAVQLGYRLALVGTALSRSADPGELCKGLIAAGRGTAVPAAESGAP